MRWDGMSAMLAGLLQQGSLRSRCFAVYIEPRVYMRVVHWTDVSFGSQLLVHFLILEWHLRMVSSGYISLP